MIRKYHKSREFRIARGYTLEYVSQKLGISKSFVSKLETFDAVMTESLLCRFADLYKCDPMSLMAFVRDFTYINVIGSVLTEKCGEIEYYSNESIRYVPFISKYLMCDRKYFALDVQDGFCNDIRANETLLFKDITQEEYVDFQDGDFIIVNAYSENAPKDKLRNIEICSDGGAPLLSYTYKIKNNHGRFGHIKTGVTPIVTRQMLEEWNDVTKIPTKFPDIKINIKGHLIRICRF